MRRCTSHSEMRESIESCSTSPTHSISLFARRKFRFLSSLLEHGTPYCKHTLEANPGSKPCKKLAEMRWRLLLLITKLILGSSFHLNAYRWVANNELCLSAKKNPNDDAPSAEKNFFFATEANNSTATKGIVVGGGTVATARYSN